MKLHPIFIACVLGVFALAFTFVQTSRADDATSPTTYTLLRKADSPQDMNTAIYRHGPREMIRLSRANGWHSRFWFDFAAHKEYAEDSNAPGQCSVVAYIANAAPELLDPVPGAFAMAAQIPANAPRSGKAKLGGVETEVIKAPRNTGTIWLDPKRHMVIKFQTVMKGSKRPVTVVDLTGISFDEPDSALLKPPAHCKRIAGSANAYGGHASVPVEATS